MTEHLMKMDEAKDIASRETEGDFLDAAKIVERISLNLPRGFSYVDILNEDFDSGSQYWGNSLCGADLYLARTGSNSLHLRKVLPVDLRDDEINTYKNLGIFPIVIYFRGRNGEYAILDEETKLKSSSVVFNEKQLGKAERKGFRLGNTTSLELENGYIAVPKNMKELFTNEEDYISYRNSIGHAPKIEVFNPGVSKDDWYAVRFEFCGKDKDKDKDKDITIQPRFYGDRRVIFDWNDFSRDCLGRMVTGETLESVLMKGAKPVDLGNGVVTMSRDRIPLYLQRQMGLKAEGGGE